MDAYYGGEGKQTKWAGQAIERCCHKNPRHKGRGRLSRGSSQTQRLILVRRMSSLVVHAW